MNFSVDSSAIVFRGRVFDVQVDDITYDSGNKGIREIALHNGGAVVVPLNRENRLIFIKQFRYPLQDWLIELPAGKLERNEDPLHCAVRELTEEAGYTAGTVTPLGSIVTTPGFCTERLYFYYATDLTPGSHHREEGEFGMEILELSLNEAEEMIRSGKIIDAKTIAGIFYYKLMLAGSQI